MDFYNFIVDQALVLVPFLWLAGLALKHTERISDKYIPLILICGGILTAVTILGMGLQGILQGTFAAGAAVLGHQLIKQAKE